MNQLIDPSTPVQNKIDNTNTFIPASRAITSSIGPTATSQPYLNSHFTPNTAKALEESFRRRRESFLPRNNRRSFFDLDLKLGEATTSNSSHSSLHPISPLKASQTSSSKSNSIQISPILSPQNSTNSSSQMSEFTITTHTPHWRDLTNSVLKAIQSKSPGKYDNHDNKENFLDEQHTRLNIKTLDISKTPILSTENRKRPMDSPCTPSNIRTSKNRRILGKSDINRTKSNLSTSITNDDSLSPTVDLESIFQRAVETRTDLKSALTPKITKIIDLQNEIQLDKLTSATVLAASCNDNINTMQLQLENSQYESWRYQKLLEESQSLVEFLELERRFKAY